MITLKDKQNATEIGEITEQQLQFLIDELEEEFPEDRDYYIRRETIEAFESRGIDPELLRLLRAALGERGDMEIVWSRS